MAGFKLTSKYLKTGHFLSFVTVFGILNGKIAYFFRVHLQALISFTISFILLKISKILI